MKKFAFTALLAVISLASAQQNPCLGHGSAPLPSTCMPNHGQRPTLQAAPVYRAPHASSSIYRAPHPRYQPLYQRPVYPAPVYQAPVYQTPIYQTPVYQPPVYQQLYVPAPPPAVSVNIQPWDDDQTLPLYSGNQWDGWDGDHVDIYINNTLVLQNVYRSDVSRLQFNRPGRYLIQVVPVGYSYDEPIFTRYYDAPQTGTNLTFSFGGNFNIVLR